MTFDFTGRTVLVTGATRGIGRELARAFGESGGRLILTGTRQEQIDELNRESPGHHHYHHVDFTDLQSTERFLETIGKYDRIDVCVNNAGINRIADIDQVPVEDWHEVVAVNLTAPFLITRQVARAMKRNGYGRIVNIGSVLGVVSRRKRSVYTSTKFGLRGLTVAAALDLAEHGVLVNAVSPGFVLTDLTRTILSEEEITELSGQVPLKRMASPEEIVPSVLFLASELNTYITGHNLIVDGGFVNV